MYKYIENETLRMVTSGLILSTILSTKKRHVLLKRFCESEEREITLHISQLYPWFKVPGNSLINNLFIPATRGGWYENLIL